VSQPIPSNRRLKFSLALLLAFGLGVIHFAYARIVCQLMPHQDDWMLLAGLLDPRAGDSAPWLFVRHNGHLLVPARLVFWLAAAFGHLDLTWVRWLCAATAALSALLWVRWLRRHLVHDPAVPLLVAGGAVVIFSLSYWEYYSIAIGFSAYLAALLGVSGLAWMIQAEGSHRPWPAAAIGIACLAGAALTFGSGYGAVAAAGVWFAMETLRRRGLRLARPAPVIAGAAVFALGAAATWLPPPGLDLPHRLCLCTGGFAAQALPDSPPAKQALFAGSVGALLAGLAVWRLLTGLAGRAADPADRWGDALLWCGLLTCGAVAWTRRVLPAEEMLSARYAIHFAPALLGLLLSLRHQVRLRVGLVAALAGVTLLAGRQELRVAPYRRAGFAHLAALLPHLSTLTDAEVQKEYYWSGAAEIRRVATAMERDKLGVFASPPPP